MDCFLLPTRSKQQLDETQFVPEIARNCLIKRQSTVNPSCKEQEQQDLEQSQERVPHARLAISLAGLAGLGWLTALRGAGEHGTTSHPCGLIREPACLSGNSCPASGLQHLETSLLCFEEGAAPGWAHQEDASPKQHRLT